MACPKEVYLQELKKKYKNKLEFYRSLYGEAIRLARGWHDIIEPYLSKSGRKKLYQKCGISAFLLIEYKGGEPQFKFPIADPETCEPHPKGVAAAFLRAYMLKNFGEKYQKVLEEAAELLEDYLEDGKIDKKPRPIIWVGKKRK